MYPQGLFGVESFFYVLALVAIGATWYLVVSVKNEGYSAWRLLALQLVVALVALLGAKIFSWYLRDWHVYSLSDELRSGWSYPGALIAIILGTPILVRFALPGFSLARYGDKLAIATAFGAAAIRLNCMLVGCCTGAVCDGLVCLSYAPHSEVWYQHVHSGLIHGPDEWSLHVLPLHLFFMAASFAVGIFLLWFDDRRQFNGQLILIFLLLHEGSKAGLELLRVPSIVDLQLVSVAIAVMGATGLILCPVLFRRKLGMTRRTASM